MSLELEPWNAYISRSLSEDAPYLSAILREGLQQILGSLRVCVYT